MGASGKQIGTSSSEHFVPLSLYPTLSYSPSSCSEQVKKVWFPRDNSTRPHTALTSHCYCSFLIFLIFILFIELFVYILFIYLSGCTGS